MNYSQDCYDLAAESEGCILRAYDDARPDHILQPGDTVMGALTIGRGHTGPDVHIGLEWTQEQANAQLAADLQVHCEQMNSVVKVPLTQGQTDALTDFTYEEGIDRLRKSTLLILLNGRQYSQVPGQLYRVDNNGDQHGYIFAGGKILPGLITRRQKEIELWNKTA